MDRQGFAALDRQEMHECRDVLQCFPVKDAHLGRALSPSTLLPTGHVKGVCQKDIGRFTTCEAWYTTDLPSTACLLLLRVGSTLVGPLQQRAKHEEVPAHEHRSQDKQAETSHDDWSEGNPKHAQHRG